VCLSFSCRRATFNVFDPITNFEGRVEGLVPWTDAGVDRILTALKVSLAVKGMLSHPLFTLTVRIQLGSSVLQAVWLLPLTPLFKEGVWNWLPGLHSAPTEFGFTIALRMQKSASLIARRDVNRLGLFCFELHGLAFGKFGQWCYKLGLVLANDCLSLLAGSRDFITVRSHAKGLVL